MSQNVVFHKCLSSDCFVALIRGAMSLLAVCV